MKISQSMDQLRLGLQTAKELSRQAAGNYGAIELIGSRAESTAPSTGDAVSIGEQAESTTLARESLNGAVTQALKTVNELGLPAAEIQPLRTALESALREDDLGVFDRMQIKTGWQSALQQLEEKADEPTGEASTESRFQRAADAADSSDDRHTRIERYVDKAIDVLTDLEMRHGSNETEIVPFTPPVTAPNSPDPVPAKPVAPPPVEVPAEHVPPQQPPSGPLYSPNPYPGNWNGSGSISVSTGWSPATTSGSSTSDDLNALSDAVWGKGEKSETQIPSPGLSASTGNLYSDFLLDRGSFTPKEEEKKDDDEDA